MTTPEQSIETRTIPWNLRDKAHEQAQAAKTVTLIDRTGKWISAWTDKPTPQDVMGQWGLFYEEINEGSVVLRNILDIYTTHLSESLKETEDTIKTMNRIRESDVARLMNGNPTLDPIMVKELIDHLGDCAFVAFGLIKRLGFEPNEVFKRIVESNETKFVDGVPLRDENGKFLKGPDYVKVNFDSLIDFGSGATSYISDVPWQETMAAIKRVEEISIEKNQQFNLTPVSEDEESLDGRVIGSYNIRMNGLNIMMERVEGDDNITLLTLTGTGAGAGGFVDSEGITELFGFIRHLINNQLTPALEHVEE